MPDGLQRVTVNLVSKSAASLDRLSVSTGLSKTDVINRALQVYDFIDSETEAGKQILVRAADGTVEVLRLL